MKKQSDSGAVILAEQPVVSGTTTGTLVGFMPSGEALVDLPGENALRPLSARTCVALHPSDVGRAVVVVFEQTNLDSPIVLGLLQPPSARSTEVEVDGNSVVVTGREKIVLRCGDASITLSRDGKVVIRGEHVVTHASGVNRIRGGSVQLN